MENNLINRVVANRYVIIRHLGSGGQGSVYLVTDNKLNKQWALKTVGRISGDELNTLKRVNHPAFPRITDVVNIGDMTGLIMDYIPGESLSDYARSHTISTDMLYEWMLEIAEAMRYLHSITPVILYLDCKPSNIILGEDGHLHMVDLGSSYIVGLSSDHRISGTLPYASPEQVQGRDVDVRSDIYALGMTIKTIGRLSTGHMSLAKYVRYKISYDKRLATLSYVASRCISQNRSGRYQSTDELIYNLNHPESIEYRLPSIGIVIRRLTDILYKNVVAIFSILSFHIYSQSHNLPYMLLGTVLLILLILLSARNSTDRSCGVWHCYKDIYLRDITGILLLGTLCVILCGTHSHAATQTLSVQSADAVMTDGSAPPAPKITIYDQDGVPVLYKGQYAVKVGDDIRVYIPNESLATSHIPTRIEVSD